MWNCVHVRYVEFGENLNVDNYGVVVLEYNMYTSECDLTKSGHRLFADRWRWTVTTFCFYADARVFFFNEIFVIQNY